MKVLIVEPTQVNYGDDRGGQHEDAGAIVDVTKEVARSLTSYSRALYVSKADDPHKDARNTATKEQLKAAEDLAKARSKTAAPDPQ